MKRKTYYIPIPAIMETLFFRGAAAASGYYYGLTEDLLCLAILAACMARAIHMIYGDLCKSDREMNADLKKYSSTMHDLGGMDPNLRTYMLTGMRISSVVFPFMAPPVYAALGYAAVFPRSEFVAAATIIVLLIGRIAELIYNDTAMHENDKNNRGLD